MKKSNLYSVYSLLFVIIASVADNRLIIGLAAIVAVVFMITSLVLVYFENKYN